MADASALKHKRGGLGSPPPPSDASSNLSAPETAPLEVAPKDQTPLSDASKERIDGRTLRRTTRVVQLATRVTPDFDLKLREIARRDNLLIVEVLEKALSSYEKTRS